MAEGLGKKPGASAGLAGRDSFNFVVFPPLIWLMRPARPDLEVHVLVENVPDIGKPHRAAAKTMLDVAEHDWLVLKSGGPFQRERCFVSTLPAGGRARAPPRRRGLAIFDRLEPEVR
eukprot:11333141-Alexandrium_andersonii.AAC.1